MWSKSLTLMALTFAIVSQANAAEIAKWVDEHGVTHFGNPQFAPATQSEKVEVQPANAMDAPDTSVLSQRTRVSHKVVTIKKAAKKNKRGWRGYRSTSRTRRGYR